MDQTSLAAARLAVRMFYLDAVVVGNNPILRIIGQVYGSNNRTAIVHLRGAFPYIYVPLNQAHPTSTVCHFLF